MKIPGRNSALRSKRWLFGLALPLLALSIPVFAELGGDVTTVQNDQARMKGTLKVTEAQAYTIHEITSPEGSIRNGVLK